MRLCNGLTAGWAGWFAKPDPLSSSHRERPRAPAEPSQAPLPRQQLPTLTLGCFSSDEKHPSVISRAISFIRFEPAAQSEEYCSKQKLATHTYLVTWEHLTNDAYSKGWGGHDRQALDGRC
jgi:hypothetical protein